MSKIGCRQSWEGSQPFKAVVVVDLQGLYETHSIRPN